MHVEVKSWNRITWRWWWGCLPQNKILEQACAACLWHPEFFRWWHSATPAEQKKATKTAANGQVLVSKHGANDYEITKSMLDTARESGWVVRRLWITSADWWRSGGPWEVLERTCHHQLSKLLKTFTLKRELSLVRSVNVIDRIFCYCLWEQITDWHEPHIVEGLSSYHWLMQSNPTDELVSCLARFKPGTVLADKEGHYWIKWSSPITDSLLQWVMTKNSTTSKSICSVFPSLMRMK